MRAFIVAGLCLSFVSSGFASEYHVIGKGFCGADEATAFMDLLPKGRVAHVTMSYAPLCLRATKDIFDGQLTTVFFRVTEDELRNDSLGFEYYTDK
jgi:hypothetical protein